MNAVVLVDHKMKMKTIIIDINSTARVLKK